MSIKVAAVHLLKPIQFIINQSIATGTFPTQWKLAKLIPLLKSKDICPFNPSHYRPISILPVVSKLVERAVQVQMMSFLTQTNQINRNHHAYRKKFSTTSAMLQLTDKIYKSTDKNLITTLLTIDKSAAFDCVPHDTLIEKMKLYNFSSSCIKWFNSYLSGRSQYVEINTKRSKITNMVMGVPQGSVLGPLMYTLYINELPNILKDTENCDKVEHEPHTELFGQNCETCPEIPCYADDATVVYASDSRQNNQVKMRNHLAIISGFLSSNKLAINEEKTTINEIMVPQKRMKLSGAPPTLTVTDRQGELKTLQACNFTRLLGMNVSRNLCWTDHLESGDKHFVLPILRRQLGALFLLAKQIPKSSRLLLVNGLFMSKLTYLMQIWGAAPKTLLRKVQVLMNKAARFVTGRDKRTRSTIKLMDECKWLPVADLVKYQSLISMWTIIHRKIPIQLAERIQIDNDMILTTNAPRLMTVAHGYRWRTIALWNQLDMEIRKEAALPRFKRAVKIWLISQRQLEPD